MPELVDNLTPVLFQFSAYPQVASLQAAEVLVNSVSSAARGVSGTVESRDVKHTVADDV